MKYFTAVMLVCCVLSNNLKAQEIESNDSIVKLNSVTITPIQQSPERMPETKGNVIFLERKMKLLN